MPSASGFWPTASVPLYSNLIQLWVSFTCELSTRYVGWSLHFSQKGICVGEMLRNSEGKGKLLCNSCHFTDGRQRPREGQCLNQLQRGLGSLTLFLPGIDLALEASDACSLLSHCTLLAGENLCFLALGDKYLREDD